MPEGDLSNLARDAWDASWGDTPVYLGYSDNINPDIQRQYDEIKVGSLGKQLLGERCVGITAVITVEVREVTRTTIENLHPWFTGTTGTDVITLNPPIGVDMYDYAELLRLHPRSQTDKHLDLIAPKAVPVTAFNLSRNGQSDDIWSVVFHCYPDRDQLPNIEVIKFDSATT